MAVPHSKEARLFYRCAFQRNEDARILLRADGPMRGSEMAIAIPRGGSDEVIEQIIEALRPYETDHPGSQIDLYRQNPVSIRIRIIDPDFAGRSKVERNRTVWNYLARLSEETQADISTLILLAPEERKQSFANFEFEDPIPSRL